MLIGLTLRQLGIYYSHPLSNDICIAWIQSNQQLRCRALEQKFHIPTVCLLFIVLYRFKHLVLAKWGKHRTGTDPEVLALNHIPIKTTYTSTSLESGVTCPRAVLAVSKNLLAYLYNAIGVVKLRSWSKSRGSCSMGPWPIKLFSCNQRQGKDERVWSYNHINI